MTRFQMTQNGAPTQPNDSEPNNSTTEVRLNSWEEFVGHVSKFDDPKRSPWDEVWFAVKPTPDGRFIPRWNGGLKKSPKSTHT
jgi:hypothetical protein